MSELDALDPVPEQVKLSTGTVIQLESLRARQFFKLLRIVTHGALPNMRDDFSIFRFEADTTPAEFAGRLFSLMALSIPDAEKETLEFLQSMCKPVGLVEGRALNKADAQRNNALWEALDAELDNPELDDLVTLVEAIVRREAQDIQALGKRLASMLNLAERTGQIPSPNPTSPASTSSADSPAPTTSSPTNTTGTTSTSATSRSAGSGRSSRRSANASSTDATNETSG